MHAYRSGVHKQEGTVYIKVCSIYINTGRKEHTLKRELYDQKNE